jgi:hypothetical protein
MERLRAFGGTPLGRTARVAVKGISMGVNAVDEFEVPLMVIDAFLNAKFPNQTDFLSAPMVQNVRWSSIQSQIDYITEYNKTIVDVYNGNPSNITQVDFPRERAQFPLIMGPLDKLDPDDEMARYVGAEYRHNRVKILVYSVAEQLLRTTGNPHRNILYNSTPATYNGSLAAWQSTIQGLFENQAADSLVHVFFNPRYYTVAQRDNLYRDAYTLVCNNYGGVVYEDTHNTDDSSWLGRPRFQCGFSNKTNCIAHTKDFMQNKGLTGGDYAEWYEFTEVNGYISQISPPTSTSNISACRVGLSNNYVTACSITPTHFRTNSMTGACLVTNSYVNKTCDLFKGVYSYDSHMCEYTQEFCQSMGMCYDRVNMVCQLPSDTMFALSMIAGGEGVVREWIKINGCGFNVQANTVEQYAVDMFRDKEGIRQGFKDTFSPTSIGGAIGFTTLVGTVGALVAGPFVAAAMIIAIGAEIGVMFAQMNAENNQQPPKPQDYPKEYAITGLTDDGSQPKSCGYAEGWRTKPLLAHTLASWPPPLNAAASSIRPTYPTDVRNLPTGRRIDFFTRTADMVIFWNRYDVEQAVTEYTSAVKDAPKNYCYENNQMRAGSNAIHNDAFCIDYKPPTGYADTNNIGELASEAVQVLDGQTPGTESYIVNRAWTDGSAPDTAQYPSLEGRAGAAWGNRPGLWYYQLVYDRDNMKLDSQTRLPLKLWDTDYLQMYFNNLTIRQMRIYYCTSTFTADPSGASIDDRCWGYLNISLPPKYKFLRMTLPGLNMTAPTPALNR